MTIVILRNTFEPIPVPISSQDVVVDLLEVASNSTIRTDIFKVFKCLGYAQQEVLDFSLLAIAVYIADRQARRRVAPDAWRRSFEVYLPVSEVDLWQGNKALAEELLCFLTGDGWKLHFRPGHNNIVPVTPPFRWADPIDAVCLFSGGLDSYIGAIDLAESGNQLALIGHWESSHTKCVQSKVHPYLNAVYGDGTKLLSVGLSPRKATGKQEYPLPSQEYPEPTSRSRSLLFISLGLLAANAVSSETALYIPENGFISLNVPWSANRYGSCTTRSTHPHTLNLLRSFLQSMGISNPVINPYQFQTKGEMLLNCLNQEVLRNGELATLSCSHPEVARWYGLPNRNCGYCLACIARRAALHAVGRDDVESQYVFDVCQDTSLVLHEGRGATVRSILHGLGSSRRLLVRLLTSGSLEPVRNNLPDIKRVFQVGVEEIRRLFADKACREILEFGNFAQQEDD